MLSVAKLLFTVSFLVVLVASQPGSSLPTSGPAPAGAVLDRYAARMIISQVTSTGSSPIDWIAVAAVEKDLLRASLKLDVATAANVSAGDVAIEATAGDQTAVVVAFLTDAADAAAELIRNAAISDTLFRTLKSSMASAYPSTSPIPHVTSLERLWLYRKSIGIHLLDAAVQSPTAPSWNLNDIRSSAGALALRHDISDITGVPFPFVSIFTTIGATGKGSIIAESVVLVDAESTDALLTAGRRLGIRFDLPRTSAAMLSAASPQIHQARVQGLLRDRGTPEPRYGETCGDGCVTPFVVSGVVFVVTVIATWIACSGETEKDVDEYASALALKHQKPQTWGRAPTAARQLSPSRSTPRQMSPAANPTHQR